MTAKKIVKSGKYFRRVEIKISGLSHRHPIEKLSKYIKHTFHPSPDELNGIYREAAYRIDLEGLTAQKNLLNERIAEIESKYIKGLTFEKTANNILGLLKDLHSIQTKISELRKSSHKYLGFFKGYVPVPEVINEIGNLEKLIHEIEHNLDGPELNSLLDAFGEVEYAKFLLANIDKRILRIPLELNRDSQRRIRAERQAETLAQKKLAAKVKSKAQLAKEDKKAKELERLKSLAASTAEDKRKILSRKKKDLRHHNQCPYCGIEFDVFSNVHADHIYPLSKGGLEVEENLVLVCSSCNLKKGNLTLREFIIKFKLNRDKIEGRLELLGKSF